VAPTHAVVVNTISGSKIWQNEREGKGRESLLELFMIPEVMGQSYER
jgi:hypothetical protein